MLLAICALRGKLNIPIHFHIHIYTYMIDTRSISVITVF